MRLRSLSDRFAESLDPIRGRRELDVLESGLRPVQAGRRGRRVVGRFSLASASRTARNDGAGVDRLMADRRA
jgi:hypothetical protein